MSGNNLPVSKRRGKLLAKITIIAISLILLTTSILGIISVETHQEGFKLGREIANSPWPMFHHGVNHTGLSPYDTSSNDGTLTF